jgi:hypothetical protein
MTLAWILAGVFAVATIALQWKVMQLRRQRRTMRNGWPWPIPTVPLTALDPVFAPGPHGPTFQTEVRFLGRGAIDVPGGTSDSEAWVIAVLARHNAQFFEFGTATGKTAYLWARNTSEHGRATTITLRVADRAGYQAAPGDDTESTTWALNDPVFDEYVYSKTDVAHRVTQLYGDSKAFDETPHVAKYDVVFVDGSHAYSYVLSDAAKAMKMVRPGGIVLWHDYQGPNTAGDVFKALNHLRESVPLQHLAGTTMVFWRRPVA